MVNASRMNRNSVPRLVPNCQARASTKLVACGNETPEMTPEFINKHPSRARLRPAGSGYALSLDKFSTRDSVFVTGEFEF